VGGALAFAAVAAHRARAGAAEVHLELPLAARRGVDLG
jgi:hypothetical protein